MEIIPNVTIISLVFFCKEDRTTWWPELGQSNGFIFIVSNLLFTYLFIFAFTLPSVSTIKTVVFNLPSVTSVVFNLPSVHQWFLIYLPYQQLRPLLFTAPSASTIKTEVFPFLIFANEQ